MMKGYVEVDFIKLCKEVAQVYFKYSELLQRYLPTLKQEVGEELISYVITETPKKNLDKNLNMVFTALAEMALIIPNLEFKIGEQMVSYGAVMTKILTFSMNTQFMEVDGKVDYVPTIAAIKDSKTVDEFEDRLVCHIEKHLDFEYQYYLAVYNTIKLL